MADERLEIIKRQIQKLKDNMALIEETLDTVNAAYVNAYTIQRIDFTDDSLQGEYYVSYKKANQEWLAQIYDIEKILEDYKRLLKQRYKEAEYMLSVWERERETHVN